MKTMDNKDPNLLFPYVKYLYEVCMAKWKIAGLHPTPTSFFRSMQEQTNIYAIGRTKPGIIQSYTKAGYSMHNYGLAFDVSFPSLEYAAAAKIAKALGLTWGGEFTITLNGKKKRFLDRPHFQWTGGLTTKKLLSGKRPLDPRYYEIIGTTTVCRMDPMQLKAAAVRGIGQQLAKTFPNFVNGNFFGYDIIGHLASEGKFIRERHEEGKSWEKPKGTGIIFKDGEVEFGLKTDTEMAKIRDKVWCCFQGFNLFPIDLAKEGFTDKSIARSCVRIAIGYNKTTNKIIITARPGSDAARAAQTLKNLGCDSGICLDSGSSANLWIGGQPTVKTDSMLTNILYW